MPACAPSSWPESRRPRDKRRTLREAAATIGRPLVAATMPLSAAMATMAIVGILMALASLLVLEVVGQIAFRGQLPIDLGRAGLTILGTCLAFALYAALGACLGALVRGQVAAIVIVLVGSFAIEPLVGLIWSDYARWLPGSAVALVSAVGNVNGTEFLQALGALIAWVLVIGFAAGATSLRRDVT